VIKRAVVADLRRFTDDDAHSMIDEKAPADARARMNLNSREPSSDMRNHAREPAQTLPPQPVREPVYQQGMKTGIAGNDFPSVSSRWIAFKNDRYFFSEPREHD
jgi:hypothetical protein